MNIVPVADWTAPADVRGAAGWKPPVMGGIDWTPGAMVCIDVPPGCIEN